MSPFPPGSWIQSARDYRARDGKLTAWLCNEKGDWMEASTDIEEGCAYSNQNGVFVRHRCCIPPRIFQTHSASTPHVGTWKAKNPRYAHSFYNDQMCLDFVKEHFDEDVVQAYQALRPGAARADLWRYCVLYVHGGVYVDADCICLQPLDHWLPSETDLVVVIDREIQPCLSLFQAFLACTPKHPLMRRAVDAVVGHVKRRLHAHSIFELCGPTCLGRCLNALHGRPSGAPWDWRRPPARTAMLRHRQFRDDSILHGTTKVVQAQLPIYRSAPSYKTYQSISSNYA